MTMTIQFVLILATAIAINGQKDDTPREATLSIKSNFEDGLSNREFRVDFPGLAGVTSADIIISKVGDKEGATPRIKHTIKEGVQKAQLLYFELKYQEAPAGLYQVQVCVGDKCSAKRAAFGEIFDDTKKATLSCVRGKGPEENVLHTFEQKKGSQVFTVEMKGGESFLTAADYAALPEPMKKVIGFSKFGSSSNPAYQKGHGESKSIFYAAVNYDGKNLKELFEAVYNDKEILKLMKSLSITPKKQNELHAHEYCKRKYIFWASAHVVHKESKVVKRRYRGTIIVSDALAVSFILNPKAGYFPVEFVRYDDVPLESGEYEVSVSFCASDKDEIDSSICSKAIHTDLTVA